jgi:hypothetical protein
LFKVVQINKMCSILDTIPKCCLLTQARVYYIVLLSKNQRLFDFEDSLSGMSCNHGRQGKGIVLKSRFQISSSAHPAPGFDK